MLDSYNVLLILLFLFTWLYLFVRRRYTFWLSRGVPGPTPTFLVGNIFQRFLQQPTDCEWNWIQRYGKVYGIFYGLLPVLTIADADLIRQVTIRDFSSAQNRRYLSTYHEIFNLNMFHLEGDEWKRVRTITSPSFTSGKLRAMQCLMQRCIDQLDRYLTRITEETGSAPIDARELFSGLTIDTIATTVFATETNANEDPGQTNAFVANGLELFRFPPLHMFGLFVFPRFLNRLLNIQTFFSNKSFHFFLQLAQQIVQQRMRSNERRDDLVQLMIDAYVYESDLKDANYDKLTATDSNDAKTSLKKEESQNQDSRIKKRLTEDEIVAQCILFFIAGFETTASTLIFCAYELAMNPEVQEHLHEELTSVIGQLEPGSEGYLEKVLNQTPYLEAVIKEALRKHPPIIRLERRVNAESYEIAGIKLPNNLLMEISILGMHYDPDYYPEPHAFKPDRWFPENRHLLIPYTYLPFGIGPRNCVGMRFAYQELKLAIALLVTKYAFEPNEQTAKKLEYRLGSPLLVVNELPVQIRRRQ